MDSVLTIEKFDQILKEAGASGEHTDITAGRRLANWLEHHATIDTVYGRFTLIQVWVDPTIGVDECYWGKPNAERLRAILGDQADGWLAPEDRKQVE